MVNVKREGFKRRPLRKGNRIVKIRRLLPFLLFCCVVIAAIGASRLFFADKTMLELLHENKGLKKSITGTSKKKGFTLIEVLVAVFLVGIAIMGLAQFFTLAVVNNSRADRIASATFLVQQRIDFLRNLTTSELTSFTLSDGTPILIDEQLDNNNDGTIDFRRLTDIQHVGFYWNIRILVFAGTHSGESSAQLLLDPLQYKVMANMSTVISR